MNHAFAYDRGEVELAIEGARWVQALDPAQAAPLTDLEARVAAGAAPLKEMLSPDDQITLVVSDITRYWMRQDLVLEPLVKFLHEQVGLAYDHMVVLVALGTHRAQTGAEDRRVASDYVYDRVRVVNHDCDGPLTALGTTSRGTRVAVNPLVVGRKVVLITGVVHHLLGGFGGGRKSIVPGVAGRATVVQNHILALDPDAPRSSPLVGMGKLDDNPLHLDMEEAAGMVRPLYAFNLVADGQGRLVALTWGDYRTAWREACRVVRRVQGLPIKELADVVVAGCGGYPKDINLYQAIKTLLNAAQAVKPGGHILFLAACPEGGGAPEFFDWIAPLREGRLDRALRDDFTIAGYIFYAACEIIARCHVRMLSQLDPGDVRAMGMTPCQSGAQLLDGIDLRGKTVYLMPTGGSVVPYRAD